MGISMPVLLKALNPEITAEQEAKGTNLLLWRTFYCDESL
jgi:hypothetical protein